MGRIPRRDPASGRGLRRAVGAGMGAVQACSGGEKPSTVGGLRVFCLAEVVLVRKPCGPPRGLMIAYGSNGGEVALEKDWDTGVSIVQAGERGGAGDLGTLCPLFEEDSARLLTEDL